MLSPRWLFLYPGLALFVVGALVQGAILTGPIAVGRVVLDIHTMLYAAGAMLKPELFPPGRARLATMPSAVGSILMQKTIGIVLLARRNRGT